jgi:hypothetical protein
MFDSALLYYDQALDISPNNSKYLHAKALTFEAQAIEIDRI